MAEVAGALRDKKYCRLVKIEQRGGHSVIEQGLFRLMCVALRGSHGSSAAYVYQGAL